MRRNFLFVFMMLVGAALAAPAAAATTRDMPVPSAQADAGRADAGRQRTLYLGVIQSLRKDGLPRAALAHLDTFDMAFPRDPYAQVLRADCLTDVKDYGAAEALYQRLVAGPVGDQAEAGLGRIAGRRGDWTAAADAFAQAVKRRPTHTPYINDLGFALIKAGRTEEGLFRLRQALELAPADALTRNNLIMALDQSGHAQEAQQLVASIPTAAERQAVEALRVGAAITPSAPPAPELKPAAIVAAPAERTSVELLEVSSLAQPRSGPRELAPAPHLVFAAAPEVLTVAKASPAFRSRAQRAQHSAAAISAPAVQPAVEAVATATASTVQSDPHPVPVFAASAEHGVVVSLLAMVPRRQVFRARSRPKSGSARRRRRRNRRSKRFNTEMSA